LDYTKRLFTKNGKTNSKKIFLIFQFQKISSILDQPVEIYQHLAKRLNLLGRFIINDKIFHNLDL